MAYTNQDALEDNVLGALNHMRRGQTVLAQQYLILATAAIENMHPELRGQYTDPEEVKTAVQLINEVISDEINT